jgi:hypothetical protein
MNMHPILKRWEWVATSVFRGIESVIKISRRRLEKTRFFMRK